VGVVADLFRRWSPRGAGLTPDGVPVVLGGVPRAVLVGARDRRVDGLVATLAALAGGGLALGTLG